MNQLPRQGSAAEDLELSKLEVYLQGIEGELTLRELEYISRHAELQIFEAKYFAVVGTRLALIDNLLSRIATSAAKRNPGSQAADAAAKDAHKRSQESEEALNHQKSKPKSTYIPSDALKKLYREGARIVHPDLGSGKEDQIRRERAMSALNDAYERGDGDAIRRIIEDFKAGAQPDVQMFPAQRIALMKSKIEKVQARLSQLAEDIKTMDESELHQLLRKADLAVGRGQDLLAMMADELDKEIAKLQSEMIRHDLP